MVKTMIWDRINSNSKREEVEKEIVRLVRMFNLHEEVYKFLVEKVKEIASEKQYFCFKGSASGECIDGIPKVVGEYPTVRYGWLQRYCKGRSGEVEIDGKKYKLTILITRDKPGDAETPGMYCGYYILTPESNEEE